MRNDPNRSYSKLVDTLLSIKIEKLRTFLRNSPAANLVEEKIDKTAISIRAVLTNYVKAIRYIKGIEHNGEPFTIRDWMRGVREDQKNGWLFIYFERRHPCLPEAGDLHVAVHCHSWSAGNGRKP
ncbi:type IV secretion system DNA-binding domain-containing protein [Escherichia coli]|uniref:type IV secretion system DNA-binding domain-containing protein n=1 Tax=Escherichia coli TaxID=562 RepID=UPI002225F355|nr:type IV secretion system DNA-binding domain-containing protein [Escherichia coli]MCW3282293.1 type IV secretion system DNA-binding domain-containing protein [Escherichia coli]